MKALKSALIVLVGTFFATAVAFAQAPAPATKAEAPSAEVKAAVAEMLEAINFRQMMNQMAAAMAQSMPQMMDQMLARSFDKLPADQQKVAKEKASESSRLAMQKSMAFYSDPEIIMGMEEIMGRAYAKRFSLAEIKTITAFYKSDAGKKMLTTAPQLMQETMPEIMALTAPKINAMIDELTKKAIEDAKATGANNKTPAKK